MLSSTLLRSVALLGAAVFPTALAVPELSEISWIGPSCASFPGWNNDTKIAGPWTVQIEHSDNPEVEGYSNTVEYSRGSQGIRWGYITFPTNNFIAKTPLQCVGSTIQARVPTSRAGVAWQPLVIADIPYDATLIYLVNGTQPKVFQHIDSNGVLQRGAYLGGYENSTTWGIRSMQSEDNEPFYYIRLLGPDSKVPTTGEELYPGEFKAFIKITGY